MTERVTARDLREFFSAFGVKAMDLTKSKEPCHALREGIEGVGEQMIVQGNSHFITMDNLKDKPIRLKVFYQIERQDTQEGITSEELAQSLEQAGLLKLPQGKTIPMLWSSFESAKWEIVKHGSKRTLVRYLEGNPNDGAQRKALDILEEDVKRNSEGFFDETFPPPSKITEIMLSSSDIVSNII